MNKENQDIMYPLNQIYFYLTEGCNLQCRHCWISPKYQNEDHIYPSLDMEIFQSIIQQAKELGLTGVKLTGGEPLLHPEIMKILDIILRYDIFLNVETNGVLCSGEIAEKIALCKSPFVSVSLDGVDAATHEWVRGVNGCFNSAIEGINNLVKAGLSPQVVMSVMKRNYNQVEDMVHLAESIGAESVKINIVQPTARGKHLHDTCETLEIEDLIELGHWVETELVLSTDLPVYFSHPLAFRPLGKIFSDGNDNCATCGILGIIGVLADGSYALCGIGQTVPELIFGHAERDRLKDVWRDSRILNDIREGLPARFEGICGNCVMKSRCLGSCLAENFCVSGSFWAPYWYCDSAYRCGLFPKSRMVKEGLL
jgi:SynChlorMet cassette radical SAM/SPASM protein ScmF